MVQYSFKKAQELGALNELEIHRLAAAMLLNLDHVKVFFAPPFSPAQFMLV
jgi:hypothetical protein